jgi:ribosomal protein L35AE/L33A
MYAKARVLGFTRGKRNQKENTSLVQVEGVSNREEAEWYFGKVNMRIRRMAVRSERAGWLGWMHWDAGMLDWMGKLGGLVFKIGFRKAN